MAGGFGKEVSRLFAEAMYNDDCYVQQRKKSGLYQNDIRNFVLEFQGEALFDHCPPREHHAFQSYVDISNRIKNPMKLGRHLKILSEKRDFDRHLANLPRQPDTDSEDDDDEEDDNDYEFGVENVVDM
jgi:hypothetical protein